MIYVVQTGAVGLHVAVVVFICIGIDTFRQLQTVSLSTAVLGIDANARSRLNSVLILSVRLSFSWRVVGGGWADEWGRSC